MPNPFQLQRVIYPAGALGRGGPSFVGPLDGYADGLAGAWSVARRLLASHTGALIRVRRSSDDEEMDFSALAEGALDVAALLTFCGGGGDGDVSRIYDQSGLGQDFAPTASEQPRIVSAGVMHADSFGRPNIRLLGEVVQATFATPLSCPCAMYSVATSKGDNNFRIIAGLEGLGRWVGASWDNTYYAQAGVYGTLPLQTSAPDTVGYQYAVAFGGDRLMVNGASDVAGGSGDPGTTSAGIQWGNYYGGNAPWDSGATDLVIYRAAHSEATMQAISAVLSPS